VEESRTRPGDGGDLGHETRRSINHGLAHRRRQELFVLPAAMKEREGRTTVVVVPFAALIGNVVQRARVAGVDCIRWQPASWEPFQRAFPWKTPPIADESPPVPSVSILTVGFL
jgi:hypothetical protein